MLTEQQEFKHQADRLRLNLELLRCELNNMETGKGWHALGYGDMGSFVMAELGISLVFLRRILAGDPVAIEQWVQQH